MLSARRCRAGVSPAHCVRSQGEPVMEPEPAGAPHPNPSDPRAAARFWIDRNARRWTTARAMSRSLDWSPAIPSVQTALGLVALERGPCVRGYWDARREFSRAAFADGTLWAPDPALFAILMKQRCAGRRTMTRPACEAATRCTSASRRRQAPVPRDVRTHAARVQFHLPAAACARRCRGSAVALNAPERRLRSPDGRREPRGGGLGAERRSGDSLLSSGCVPARRRSGLLAIIRDPGSAPGAIPGDHVVSPARVSRIASTSLRLRTGLETKPFIPASRQASGRRETHWR